MKLNDEKLLNDIKNSIKISKDFRFNDTTIRIKDLEDILNLIYQLQNENDEQKAEIERLTEECKQIKIRCGNEILKLGDKQYNKIIKLQNENAELQKQVDELKTSNEHLDNENTRLICEMDKLINEGWDIMDNEAEGCYNNGYKQAVKDTAKGIYKEIGRDDILVVQTQEYGEIEVVPIERLKEIIKKKGVEVE